MRGKQAKRIRRMAKLGCPVGSTFPKHMRFLKRCWNDLNHKEKGAFRWKNL